MSQSWIVVCVDLLGVRAHLVEEDGSSTLQHRHNPLGHGNLLIEAVREALEGILAQCSTAPRAVSVCLSGLIDSQRGIVLKADRLLWRNLPLTEFISSHFGLPVCLDNEAALIARALDPQGQKRLAVLHSSPALELGLALGGHYHHSLELPSVSLLRLLPHALPPLSRALTLRQIGLRGDAADAEALDKLETLSQDIIEVMFWVIYMLRPKEIWLSGWLSEIGTPLWTRLNQRLLAEMPEQAPCSLYLANTDELRLRGAWLHALARYAQGS